MGRGPDRGRCVHSLDSVAVVDTGTECTGVRTEEQSNDYGTHPHRRPPVTTGLRILDTGPPLQSPVCPNIWDRPDRGPVTSRPRVLPVCTCQSRVVGLLWMSESDRGWACTPGATGDRREWVPTTADGQGVHGWVEERDPKASPLRPSRDTTSEETDRGGGSRRHGEAGGKRQAGEWKLIFTVLSVKTPQKNGLSVRGGPRLPSSSV